jgi:hypothetical protein
MTEKRGYPHEFLGRCATCLDNAYLSSEPCMRVGDYPGINGYLLNGVPLRDDDCAIRRARKAHDGETSAQEEE